MWNKGKKIITKKRKEKKKRTMKWKEEKEKRTMKWKEKKKEKWGNRKNIFIMDGESVLSCKGITLGPIIKPGVHYSFAVIHFK